MARVLLAVAVALTPTAAILLADEASLRALYKATGGTAWANNSGWLGNENSCTWHGVMCDDAAVVVGLELRSNVHFVTKSNTFGL